MRRETMVAVIHGSMTLTMRVVGESGATEFNVRLKPSEQPVLDPMAIGGSMWHLYSSGVEYHSKKPWTDSKHKTPLRGCSVTGGDCYPTGSSLHGEKLFNEMFSVGDLDGIWSVLERRYKETLEA